MDIQQKRKILAKIKTLQDQIDDLENVRYKLGSAEYASASTSSGTGSRSYTRADLGKLADLIISLKKQIKSYRRLLVNDVSGGTSTTYIVYS